VAGHVAGCTKVAPTLEGFFFIGSEYLIFADDSNLSSLTASVLFRDEPTL
jgi:hypothetical protein